MDSVWRRSDQDSRSDPQPVGSLDGENVLGAVVQQGAEVAGKVEVPEGLLLTAALLPHEEHGGARAVLPPQNGVTQERAEVEVRVRDGEGGRGTGPVGVDLVDARGVALDRAGLPAVHTEVVLPRRRQLLEVLVESRHDERLQIKLEAQLRGKGP